jgi:hypothetical protein
MSTQHFHHPSIHTKTLAFHSLHITPTQPATWHHQRIRQRKISFQSPTTTSSGTTTVPCVLAARAARTCPTAPEKAVKLRDQIVQQINMKSFKTEASTPNSHVWTDIEEKVVMLLEWVLCKRHLTHCKAALQMTMRFLRQEIGMFVEEQSAQQQPQSREPATINNHSTSSESGPGAPSSAYASAASHLATPPMSPGTLAQGMGHQQHCFASQSQSLNDGAAFDSSFKPPQQSPFVFHANMPVKTEPAVRVPNIHSHRTSRSTTPRAVVNRKITSDANASKEQVVPRGFGVRKPSKTRLLSNNKSGKQPQAKPTNAQHPPNGPTVRPHAAVKASKHQQAKPEAPPGFTVR